MPPAQNWYYDMRDTRFDIGLTWVKTPDHTTGKKEAPTAQSVVANEYAHDLKIPYPSSIAYALQK